MEHAMLNLSRLLPQLAASAAQADDHLALVLVSTTAADQAERLDTPRLCIVRSSIDSLRATRCWTVIGSLRADGRAVARAWPSPLPIGTRSLLANVRLPA